MPVISLKVNRRIKDILGSSTLAITARAKELQAQGKDVVNFAAGEPDFDTPDSIKQAAIKAINTGVTKYTPSTGTNELKNAVIAKFQKDNDLIYKPSQIAVSCGAKHSLFNLIQVLTDEDDEVLLPQPYWVSYPEMIKLSGARTIFIPTTFQDNFKINARQLEKAITPRSKVLILNSPSNPTGMVYTRKELEDIAAVCVKNNLFVISDEIYEKLIYDNAAYTSIASLGKDIYDLTFTVNGVSKAYSMTGWRIGYCGGHPDIMEYVKRFQDHTTSNPSSISQAAALQALTESDETVSKMCQEFKKRKEIITRAFDNVKQIRYINPQGAFYVFCDFSKLGNTETIAKRILDEVNVAVIPGDSFGAPGYLRLSFSTSVERIQEGTKRIIDWINKNS